MPIGALLLSGRFCAVFCEQMTFAHLAEAAHGVLVGLGGTARVWRTDRMASVVVPGTDRLTPEMANLAKHYGVQIDQELVADRAGVLPDGGPAWNAGRLMGIVPT